MASHRDTAATELAEIGGYPWKQPRNVRDMPRPSAVRINECFALQWPDVDLERKAVTVHQSVSDVNGRLII
jgi:integrase